MGSERCIRDRFIALTEIRDKLDASLQFDFVCRAGICGSCGMLINGRPTLACRTLTQNHDAEIPPAPRPFPPPNPDTVGRAGKQALQRPKAAQLVSPRGLPRRNHTIQAVARDLALQFPKAAMNESR